MSDTGELPFYSNYSVVLFVIYWNIAMPIKFDFTRVQGYRNGVAGQQKNFEIQQNNAVEELCTKFKNVRQIF